MAVVVLPLFMLKLLRRIRQANEELARLVRLNTFRALHDPLTGLPNRTYFAQILEERIAEGKPFAVLMLDLDGFKAVNDRYGHQTGDKLLVQVAKKLETCIETHENNLAARLGGDEFVILSIGDANEAEQIAQCIVQALSQPFRMGGKTCSITASVGISLYPTDATRPFYLKKHADMAMYRVKQQTKNGYQFYLEGDT
jgi:diguanylate cyclase (GGDEF)-like protein